MKRNTSFAITLVTAPDLKTARILAKAALEKRLVACANLIPKLESHYWWQGKLEKSAEVLIIFKATHQNLAALEKLVLQMHPYDTAEFIVLKIESGAARYLKWIEDSSN